MFASFRFNSSQSEKWVTTFFLYKMSTLHVFSYFVSLYFNSARKKVFVEKAKGVSEVLACHKLWASTSPVSLLAPAPVIYFWNVFSLSLYSFKKTASGVLWCCQRVLLSLNFFYIVVIFLRSSRWGWLWGSTPPCLLHYLTARSNIYFFCFQKCL